LSTGRSLQSLESRPAEKFVSDEPLLDSESSEIKSEQKEEATLLETKVYVNESSHNLPFDENVEESHTFVETGDLRYWIDKSLDPANEHSLVPKERFAFFFFFFFCPTFLLYTYFYI